MSEGDPFANVAVASFGTPKAQKEAAWPLPLIDTSQWILGEPPVREWLVEGWLVRGRAALLVGEDGVGKSLLAQQLVTCVSWGKPFLGLDVVKMPTMYVTWEDEPDELWRRQRAVNRSIGVPVEATTPHLSSLVGYGNVEIGHFDGLGFQANGCFTGIAEAATARHIGLIVLDNVGRFFPGNENIRHDVASFIGAIDRLAVECNAAVLLLAHPNKTGAEYSGSTGWSAYVRQRWFMDRLKPETGAVDEDARVIRNSKANYGRRGGEIGFRWHEGAFIREVDLGDDQRAEMAATIQAGGDNDIFLACLREMTRREVAVSENLASRTFAPLVFSKMPESKGIGRGRLEAAMDRLYRIDAIERGFLWRADRKDKSGLREKCADLRADPALTGCADPAPTARRPAPTHTPYTTYMDGVAQGAATPSTDNEDQPPPASAPDSMILAPDETGDDVDL